MLTRIYAHNYRCLLNFELRPGGAGLLVGDKGSGKSSVFEVLQALQDLLLHNEEASEAFPPETLSKLDTSDLQRFELDVQTPQGALCYTLVLEHQRGTDTCVVASEELVLRGGAGDLPAYSFAHGEVRLWEPDRDPRLIPFTDERS